MGLSMGVVKEFLLGSMLAVQMVMSTAGMANLMDFQKEVMSDYHEDF